MHNDKQNRELLIQLIKEELISKKTIVTSPFLCLGPSITQKVMDQGLPIYSYELENILFDQAKDNVVEAIKHIHYDSQLKQAKKKQKEIHIERQPQNKKQKQLFQPPLIQQSSELQPIQQLQQNIVTLFHNFTQLIATQITKNVQSNLKTGKRTHKRRSEQEQQQKQQQQQQQQLVIAQEKIINTNIENNVNNIVKKNVTLSRPDTPSFDLEPQTFKSVTPQNQQFQHSLDDVYEDEFFDESVPDPKDDYKALTNQNKIIQNSKLSKVKKNVMLSRPDTPSFDLEPQKFKSVTSQNQQFQHSLDDVYEDEFFDESVPDPKDDYKAPTNPNKNMQNSKLSEEIEYPDDFVDDSQGINFSQQKSNFYNPIKNMKSLQQSRFEDSERLDFSDDIEDILL